MRGAGAAGGAEDGIALVDVLVATVLVLGLAALSVPVTGQATDVGRARSAAGYLAGRIRLTRIHAVRSGAAAALVFDGGAPWSFRLCRDGNANGVRRADVDGGLDPCDPPEHLQGRFAGVTIAFDPTVPDLDLAVGRADAVRFGRSAMVSCSPVGDCTPGSVYLSSAGGTRFGLRVSGVTGRARRLRFDPGAPAWVPD